MNKPIIYDNHQRPITYARISLTDRCNLRCFYCMPEEGNKYLPRKELLSYEELIRLQRILASHGVNKVRITGGEPFVRKDLMQFLKALRELDGVDEIHITTNGVLTTPHIPQLKELGISSVNLSIDSLDRKRFHEITRRDELPKVLKCMDTLLEYEIKTKLNAVVMDGKNTEDIIPMAELTKELPLEVRFIEEMPFNGTGEHQNILYWNHKQILNTLKAHFLTIQHIPASPYATASTYHIPGYKGKIGIIAAFSRTFCGTCNRIRITAQGMLKTCLYDQGVLDLKKLLRSETSDEELLKALLKAFGNRAANGFEAEKRRDSDHSIHESMATIGG